jgi:zinc transport system ATP-binding protein
MSTALITLKDVSFRYQGELVLDQINLTINQGDFLGVLGPNGGGKTTLLKLMLGLLTPLSGTVTLWGTNVREFHQWSQIGYVPQKAGAVVSNFPMTVAEVVGLGRVRPQRWWDVNTAADQQAITAALSAVEVLDLRHRLMSELSGGQQQRVFIAKALAAEPELLILDEPTVGIDTESQVKFYQLLRDLNQRLHLTLVLVSHDMEVVAHEATAVACLNHTIVCHGSPQSVLVGNYMEKLYGRDLRRVVHGHDL